MVLKNCIVLFVAIVFYSSRLNYIFLYPFFFLSFYQDVESLADNTYTAAIPHVTHAINYTGLYILLYFTLPSYTYLTLRSVNFTNEIKDPSGIHFSIVTPITRQLM